MRTSLVVFAIGIVGLALGQSQVQAQPGNNLSPKLPKLDLSVFRTEALDLSAKARANPNARLTFPDPRVERFTAELGGSAKHGNHIRLHALIKNIGTAATPATVICKVEIRDYPLHFSSAPGRPLGLWHGTVLKPNQAFSLEQIVKAPVNGGWIHLTVLSTHKVPSSQDFVQYDHKIFYLAPLVADLGISSMSSPPAGFPNPRTFVAKIKNFGHQQAVVDHAGGRWWKLYVSRGSKWEYITGAPIGALRLGQETTIDLAGALAAKYPSVNIRDENSWLPATFAQVGKAWKIEITGADANSGNDFKHFYFLQ